MGKIVDLTGQRFGSLLIIRLDRREGERGNAHWICQCDCGGRSRVGSGHLRTGQTTSCRSCPRGRFAGLSNSDEYRIFRGIINRCENPRVKAYPEYGGRGIRVCSAWRQDFAAFLRDMGRRPSPKHSVDRIDTNGHYEPGNCRWATAVVQCNNRRTTRRVAYRGEDMALCDAMRAAGSVVNSQTAANRIWRSGWPVELAVETHQLFKGFKDSEARAARPRRSAPARAPDLGEAA